MIRIYAATIAACVVEFQAFWDLPSRLLIKPPVSHYELSVPSNPTVFVFAVDRNDPASGLRIHRVLNTLGVPSINIWNGAAFNQSVPAVVAQRCVLATSTHAQPRSVRFYWWSSVFPNAMPFDVLQVASWDPAARSVPAISNSDLAATAAHTEAAWIGAARIISFSFGELSVGRVVPAKITSTARFSAAAHTEAAGFCESRHAGNEFHLTARSAFIQEAFND